MFGVRRNVLGQNAPGQDYLWPNIPGCYFLDQNYVEQNFLLTKLSMYLVFLDRIMAEHNHLNTELSCT